MGSYCIFRDLGVENRILGLEIHSQVLGSGFTFVCCTQGLSYIRPGTVAHSGLLHADHLTIWACIHLALWGFCCG